MLDNLHNTVKMRWRQFYSSIIERRPTHNAEELKKLSWARRIESYEAVPEIYKFFFAPFLAEGRIFPYTILTPNFEGLLQSRTTEKLVCDLDSEIYVLEKVADAVKVYGYPMEGISCVEAKIILLVSQITICGMMKNGLPASISIKFNTATEELFAPILEKIRLTAAGFGDGELSFEIRKFDYLEWSNFKFMNYARSSLLGGEKILQIILQPRIRMRVFTFLGKTFYKIISPAHLSILTDRELILIREEYFQRTIDEYGKVWNYIRLQKIVNLSLDSEGSEFPKLTIQLPDGIRIENIYQASAKQEIHQLLSRFAGITADG